MSKKLVIEYEYADKTSRVEFDGTPTFFELDEWVIFAKGILADREITYDRILELYTTETIFSAYEEGLKALADEE